MQTPVIDIVKALDTVFESADAIKGNGVLLRGARRTMQPSKPFASFDEWDRVLMELKHDFEDGLKAVAAIREAFDAGRGA